MSLPLLQHGAATEELSKLLLVCACKTMRRMGRIDRKEAANQPTGCSLRQADQVKSAAAPFIVMTAL